jgi:uncharacterized protein YeaO (DUF488 family)
MALLETGTQVFIVRVWPEAREIEDAPVAWRGVIEHVPTNQRRYFTDLSDVNAFIGSYLEDLDARSDRIDG